MTIIANGRERTVYLKGRKNSISIFDYPNQWLKVNEIGWQVEEIY